VSKIRPLDIFGRRARAPETYLVRIIRAVRMDTRRRLGRLHQQEAQQGIALLADVS
jgi:hypothetical protein